MSIFRSIRFRLTLWFVAMMAAAVLIVSFAVYLGLRQALLSNVDATLRRAAERSVQASQRPVEANASARERADALTFFSLTPTRLVDLDGTIAEQDALFPRDIPDSAATLNNAREGISRFETLALASGDYRLLTAPLSANGRRIAAVQVAQSLQTEYAALDSLRRLLLIVVPGMLLLAALGGALLSQRAFAPMERVRRDVETIIDDSDLSRRVGMRLGQDEVGRLAHTFDRLLERLQGVMGRERQFAADASHELRSPLTAIKGELSVALSRERSNDEYKAVLNQLNGTVDDMNGLVEDLLTLARSSAMLVRVEPFDMAESIRKVCETLAVVAGERKIALSFTCDPSAITMRGDAAKLRRVLVNLIDNALRYTPAGGAVHVRAAKTLDKVRIDVLDTGIGIPARHQPHIFGRFYRVDNSRTRDAGGTGLGLAIVKTIIDAHGGSISIDSQEGRGSCFSVVLNA
jgi:heavy metal sensor kinase